jgi:hypothetical protein
MIPLHKAFAAAIFALALAACARDAPTAKKDPTPVPAPKTEAHGLSLGAPIPAGATNVALADVAKNPDAYKGKSITTTGTVTSVCQHMGCWMEIKDDASQAHIKMAGHDFFVPKTASGRKARVAATVVACSDDDESDCKQEAQQQMGHAVAKLQLEATGVELD